MGEAWYKTIAAVKQGCKTRFFFTDNQTFLQWLVLNPKFESGPFPGMLEG